jgi:hypothetical protein
MADLNDLFNALKPQFDAAMQSYCQRYLPAGGAAAIPMQSGANGGACYPTPGMGGGFPPSLNLPGCKVKCDSCAFPSLDTDLRLFSWPQIDSEMWDTDTKLDVIIAPGAFPLAPGSSVTLQQEADRNLTWIPACAQISTTWSGGPPQPGLVSYQWQVGPKAGVGGTVQFSNQQNGLQYEPNPSQTNQVAMPRYKGCDTQVIGALSALQLVVSLAASATSVLEAVTVVVYHKRAEDFRDSCCTSCSTGGSCNCK